MEKGEREPRDTDLRSSWRTFRLEKALSEGKSSSVLSFSLSSAPTSPPPPQPHSLFSKSLRPPSKTTAEAKERVFVSLRTTQSWQSNGFVRRQYEAHPNERTRGMGGLNGPRSRRSLTFFSPSLSSSALPRSLEVPSAMIEPPRRAQRRERNARMEIAPEKKNGQRASVRSLGWTPLPPQLASETSVLAPSILERGRSLEKKRGTFLLFLLFRLRLSHILG